MKTEMIVVNFATTDKKVKIEGQNFGNYLLKINAIIKVCGLVQ